MKKTTFSEEQIADALRQAEAGTPVVEVCRKLGVSEQTFSRWKRKVAGRGISELRRLRQLEEENRKLKQIEGIAFGGGLHPIQQAFWDNHALQCGFCTAGIVLSTYELLERNPAPTDAEIEDVLGGHLCRCTGYQAIDQAMRAAADRLAGSDGAKS